jgi:hypothetical protein
LPEVPEKIAGFSRFGTIEVLAVYAILGVERSVGTMEEDSELAIAMIVVVFAAVLLVTAQLFIEYRSSKSFDALAISAMTLRGEKGVFDAVASRVSLRGSQSLARH